MTEQNVSIKVSIEGKNMIVAYLLWWFLGWAGVHRFYLGRTNTGLAQLILFVLGMATAIIGVGFVFLFAVLIWWMLDAYFTYKIVVEENQKLGVNNSSIFLSKTADVGNELDQLEKLHGLYEKGVLTQEEYEKKKSKLL